jgi:hypothetical protein
LENLQTFKNLQDDTLKVEKAKTIFQDFLSQGSLFELEVNEKECLKNIENKIKSNKIEESLFTEIQKIIESKVEETLLRFQKEEVSTSRLELKIENKNKQKLNISNFLNEIFIKKKVKNSPGTPTTPTSDSSLMFEDVKKVTSPVEKKKNSFANFINSFKRFKNEKTNSPRNGTSKPRSLSVAQNDESEKENTTPPPTHRRLVQINSSPNVKSPGLKNQMNPNPPKLFLDANKENFNLSSFVEERKRSRNENILGMNQPLKMRNSPMKKFRNSPELINLRRPSSENDKVFMLSGHCTETEHTNGESPRFEMSRTFSSNSFGSEDGNASFELDHPVLLEYFSTRTNKIPK